MSEMVERVAVAIALAGNGGTWDDWYNEDQREFHRKRARAAIEAMQEPTEAMYGAVDNSDKLIVGDGDRLNPWTAIEAWKLMITAALGAGEGGE